MTVLISTTSPACGALKLRRQIGTGAGLIFKGSGFYLTDYRSDSYKKAAEAEKRLILETLDTLDGNKKEAAEVLGISLKTLYNRLHEYGEM